MLYNKTLDTFPGAIYLLCASIILVGTILNFILYSQKWRIELFTSYNGTEEKEMYAKPAVIEQKLNNDYQSGWASSSLWIL